MEDQDRWKYLVPWVTECLCTVPEIIRNAKDPESIYGKMYEIWCADVQSAFKEVLRQVMEDNE